MRIAMFSNAYLPRVGGVTRSIVRFRREFQDRGHPVIVVAPRYETEGPAAAAEEDVLRVPAIQNFNGSDFSVGLPAPRLTDPAVDRFRPDVVHAHQPFLLGDAALRIARARRLPLVFTHHTMYERYTHYVPLETPRLKTFAIELSRRFADAADQVFAPSESVKAILEERGVSAPVAVVPTGVDTADFREGDGLAFRKARGIPPGDFLVGHLGRLRPEKNLDVLGRAVASFLKDRPGARFLLVGEGSEKEGVKKRIEEAGAGDRFHEAGTLEGREIVDAYHAMDVFAFASTSETQGMVLVEAMAAGTPVAALDGPGVREVMQDGETGRLVQEPDPSALARALDWLAGRSDARRKELAAGARSRAASFDTSVCAQKALDLYGEVLDRRATPPDFDEKGWDRLLRTLKNEWELWSGRAGAALEAAARPEPDEEPGLS